MEPWPLYQMLDRDMASRAGADARLLSVSFHPSVKLAEISMRSGKLRTLLDNGRELQADVVVLATGVKPNTELAKRAGLKVGPTGGLVVDEYLRAEGFDHVYGVGTVIEYKDPVTGKPTTSMLGSFAVQVARVAASNTAGAGIRFRGAVQAAVVKGFTVLVGSAGLTLHQAREEGFNPVQKTVVYPEKAHYMPDTTRTVVKLIADGRTGRVLGGQVIGYTNAVKGRVDLVALAVKKAMTVEDLALSDWSYTPAASDVWEPVTAAAYLLLSQFRK
jgi:NADPH-dependent 2,4-dienoyl-CoA reductase/sulfur reductase-like enzyme